MKNISILNLGERAFDSPLYLNHEKGDVLPNFVNDGARIFNRIESGEGCSDE